MSEEKFRAYLRINGAMNESQLDQLTPLFRYRDLEKGTVLLNIGDVCHHYFFVASGLLRAYSIDSAGKPHIIQFAPENWLIADRSSMYFGAPSELIIDCIEDSEIFIIDQQFVQAASAISPEYLLFNERTLQNHILQLQKRINLLLGAPAEQRYLHFIQLYPALVQRVPQWMIASYLGIAPESLSRVRREIARKP